MINQFRSLNPLNLILLTGIAILLCLGIFIRLPDQLSFELAGPFTRLLITIPLEYAFLPSTNVLIALFLTLLQAILFNRLINSYNLLGKPTYLPALLYVTVSSLFVPFLILSPALICNFLLIWMIEKFLSIYRRDDARSVMFDLGMLTGAGTLLYFPFIAMLPLLWISLIIFRPFEWREWITGIIGFCTVFFFLAVFYYWNDALDKFYTIWLPLTGRFPTSFRINVYDYLVLIPVILILALGIFKLRNNFFRSYVQVRKSFQLLFFMFVLAALSFYLKAEFRLYHFLLCVPPASLLMAYYFLNAKRRWIYESVYLVLIVCIIYFQLV